MAKQTTTPDKINPFHLLLTALISFAVGFGLFYLLYEVW